MKMTSKKIRITFINQIVDGIDTYFPINMETIKKTYHMVDKKELTEIVRNIKLIQKMFGKFEKGIQNCEKTNRIYARRSLVAAMTIPKNAVIEKDMISIKRPSLGIEPANWKKILKKKAKRTINAEEPIKWKDLK